MRLAREVDSAGFHALYAADHPGSAPAPFVALAAAAGVTERVRLGTCVANAGVWEPVALASAVATLDVLSDGRAILGVGAGHTPHEWTSIGRAYPSAADRVGRMIEIVETTAALLEGRPISYAGRHVELDRAVIESPRPVQERIPMLIGGNGTRVLRFAARSADIVGIAGLGRTLADGHRHEVDWSPAATERTLATVRAAARLAARDPEIEALVQVVEITDRATPVAERIARSLGALVDDVLDSPYIWLGSVDAICAKIASYDERGIGNYVIRSAAVDNARRIISAMT